MMKTYIEISISADESQRELLIPTMVELGCEGFQEIDNALLCYVDKIRWTNERNELFKEQLKKLHQTISANASIQFREIIEENWNEQWERSIQPIEVGNKLVIKPSWCNYEKKNNRFVIQIDPKMSFGTGYHETTRLTLRLLEKYLHIGFSMLDVGTGTGILAIAAIKLGATSAVGIDNDEWSIENARENVIINHVEDKVDISTKTLQEFPGSSFDIITANLTLNTNIDLLNGFKRLLQKSGVLLLSGLLASDKDKMIHALQSNIFDVTEIISENEWIAIAANK
jgi:ribosomal protein L11 methyltransferase